MIKKDKRGHMMSKAVKTDLIIDSQRLQELTRKALGGEQITDFSRRSGVSITA